MIVRCLARYRKIGSCLGRSIQSKSSSTRRVIRTGRYERKETSSAMARKPFEDILCLNFNYIFTLELS